MKKLLIGPYEVRRELWHGKHAILYEAWEPGLARRVTLKVLRHYDDETLKKFQIEARRSAQFNSPNVRRIFQAGQTPEGQIYLAMEYVEYSLREIMHERQTRQQPFTCEEVAHLLAPIAQALDDIHAQGLVHLDIKPENILVTQQGHALLADFGIARRQGGTTGVGTPQYLSPEQASADAPVGPWSDVYSLGVVLYEMLTGRPPFQGENDLVLVRQHKEDAPPPLRPLNPQVDAARERVVLAALSKLPQERPASAGAFLQAFQNPPPERRRGGYGWLALLLALAVLAAIGYGLLRGCTPVPPSPSPTATHTVTATLSPSPGPASPTPASLTATPTFVATSTPRPATPTFTPAPVTVTPVVVGPLVNCTRAPAAGAGGVRSPVNLVWCEPLTAGQSYRVYLYRPEGKNSYTHTPSSNSISVSLPKEQYGLWEWSVAVIEGGHEVSRNKTWTFIFTPN